jgi:hypothetical protein
MGDGLGNNPRGVRNGSGRDVLTAAARYFRGYWFWHPDFRAKACSSAKCPLREKKINGEALTID